MPFDAEIGKQMKFTAEDLEYNQRGELSPKQLLKLRRDAYVSGFVAVVFACLFILMGIAMLFVEFMLGVVALIIGLFIGYVGWIFVRRSLQAKVPLSITGRINHIDFVPRMGRFIMVGNRRFAIGYKTVIVPRWGEKTFIFYFVEPSNLLSVEEVNDAAV